jgi:hypothetical protein
MSPHKDWWVEYRGEEEAPPKGHLYSSPMATQAVLDYYGIDYDPDNEDWQSIHCPVHDDRKKSASVKISRGRTPWVRCHACDFRGSLTTVVMMVEGMDYREAIEWISTNFV